MQSLGTRYGDNDGDGNLSREEVDAIEEYVDRDRVYDGDPVAMKSMLRTTSRQEGKKISMFVLGMSEKTMPGDVGHLDNVGTGEGKSIWERMCMIINNRSLDLRILMDAHDRRNFGFVSIATFRRSLCYAFGNQWIELSMTSKEFAEICEPYLSRRSSKPGDPEASLHSQNPTQPWKQRQRGGVLLISSSSTQPPESNPTTETAPERPCSNLFSQLHCHCQNSFHRCRTNSFCRYNALSRSSNSRPRPPQARLPLGTTGLLVHGSIQATLDCILSVAGHCCLHIIARPQLPPHGLQAYVMWQKFADDVQTLAEKKYRTDGFMQRYSFKSTQSSDCSVIRPSTRFPSSPAPSPRFGETNPTSL